MKKKRLPIFRFLVGLIISAAAGYVSSLLIPVIEPKASLVVSSLIKNTTYHPITLFILLALIPMLVSFIVGFGVSLIFRPRREYAR